MKVTYLCHYAAFTCSSDVADKLGEPHTRSRLFRHRLVNLAALICFMLHRWHDQKSWEIHAARNTALWKCAFLPWTAERCRKYAFTASLYSTGTSDKTAASLYSTGTSDKTAITFTKWLAPVRDAESISTKWIIKWHVCDVVWRLEKIANNLQLCSWKRQEVEPNGTVNNGKGIWTR